MSLETEFQSEEVILIDFEKAIIVILWLLIEVVGSVLLIGLIQFERLYGDPCKRRIVDQVSLMEFYNISKDCWIVIFLFSFSQFNTFYFLLLI